MKHKCTSATQNHMYTQQTTCTHTSHIHTQTYTHACTHIDKHKILPRHSVLQIVATWQQDHK